MDEKNVEQQTDDDKRYIDAAGRVLGKMYAEVFLGMVEGGMTREEALDLMRSYVLRR